MSQPSASSSASALHDFDFLVGRWKVAHRRLKRRLANCDEWETFDGTCDHRKILGGLGNFDENVVGLPSGAYEAVALRLFDATANQWSIFWVDARTPVIEPPVRGRFENGVGAFVGDDTF